MPNLASSPIRPSDPACVTDEELVYCWFEFTASQSHR